jgi:hypothetical protein
MPCFMRLGFCLILPMQTFFNSLDDLQQLTSSLDHHALVCPHCHARGQLVSHGFVYKQRSQQVKEPVGKRILCSPRSGRTGCGRTVQLYLATEIPAHHYGTAQLFAFISALLASVSIVTAYSNAIAKETVRHAWRWSKKLMQQLIVYRIQLQKEDHGDSSILKTQSRSRRILLPTLQALFSRLHAGLNPVALFQHAYQVRFI